MLDIFSGTISLLLALLTWALIVALSLGMGWILTRILPLSLFEGTVISMIGVIGTWIVWHDTLQSISLMELEEEIREYSE